MQALGSLCFADFLEFICIKVSKYVKLSKTLILFVYEQTDICSDGDSIFEALQDPCIVAVSQSFEL